MYHPLIVAFAADCTDCGPRYYPSPSPPLPPSAPKCELFMDMVLVLDKSGRAAG